MLLSVEKRVILVEYVFREANRNTDLVQEQFNEKFPQTPVHHCNAVSRLIEKFREKGSVLDAERSGIQSKLNDKMLIDISDSNCGVHQNHCVSRRKRNISGLQERISGPRKINLCIDAR
jgi:GH35 family endo-1,4-beta-xylanase